MLMFIKYLITFGIAMGVAIAVAVAYIIYDVSKTLPSHESLARYEPPVMTRIHAGDGSLLAEYARERRLFVPYTAIPERLVQAVISAEDKNFFHHPGVDIEALVRAVVVNLQAAMTGSNRRFIGASTITQQVAKNFLLTNERTIQRKLNEALIAIRMEGSFSKQQIMELYLNEIFLGQGSYGVAAASLNYFGKSLADLDLAQIAYLAALPKGPSNYHPVRNRERAIERRNWVLERMQENGYISENEMKEAQAKDIEVTLRPFGAKQFAAEYFTEEARQAVERIYGKEVLRTGGLSVRTTIDPKLQIMARQALAAGLIKFDRNHGWRGAVSTLEVNDEWPAKLAAMDQFTDVYPWQLAIVLEVSDEQAVIGLRPARVVKGKPVGKAKQGVIPLENLAWAREARGIGEKGAILLGEKVKSATQVLKAGDVVYVAPTGQGDTYHLVQMPEVEGGLIAMDPHTGRVLALAGGFSYSRSQFDRAMQAKRQPGSAIKPFVYAAALDNGYTPSSTVLDAPVEIKLQNGETWKPSNYSNKFYGPSTLRRGIEFSRNVMTVRLAQDMGIEKFTGLTEQLGIYDNLQPMLATSLGSGETTLLRMTTAYSILANGGKKVEPTLIDRIQDRYGRTVWRHDKRECTGCNAAEWNNQPEPEFIEVREQVMNPFTAYQITSMLEGVVERGTGSALQQVGKPVAGKTGTTNDERDAWFIGYTPDLVVGVYVGYDRPRAMGKGETGGALAAPVVANFMKMALHDKPAIPFRVPAGVRLIPIDPKSGKRGVYGEDNVILEAFKPGEEPPARQRLVTGGDALASSGINVGRDGIVIQGGQGSGDGGAAAVSEGGLTTGTGGLY
jgi:penicillin-binding protein 1A